MNRLFFLLVFSFFANIVVAQKIYIIPTPFDSCPKPPFTDYSRLENWAAHPSKLDNADRIPKGLKNNQDSALADVFFIHPTTFMEKATGLFQWNADVKDANLNLGVDQSPIQYQASIFNGSCKVYAPRYRQAHFYCFKTPNLSDKWKALDFAYQDVKHAFEYYLKNFNHKRPIVIAAHSQGTIHAARLLKEFFSDTLKKQLVIAYLVGMPVPTDSLPKIDFCSVPNQTQCWVSWRSYEHGFVPNTPWMSAKEAICINPISWQYNNEYIPKELSKGSVLIPFNKVLKERCDAQVHEGILWVSKPRFRGSFLYQNPNYHMADLNFYYMDIRENLELRLAQFLKIYRNTQ